MGSRSQGSRTPTRSPQVSRRLAQQAREELAAGGLSHQERRRLRALLRSRAAAADKHRGRRWHLAIVAVGAIIAMAITAVSFGLIPAIEAAQGGGVTGSFVVSDRVCSSKTGCQWVGTFDGPHGDLIAGLAYGGVLPAGDGPGSTINVRYPGGSEVYALRGSHTWVFDLLIMLVIGAAVGAALWVSPLGDGRRTSEGVGASA
jgi:hypothetical protein